ncbi:synaptotagmin-like protein 1 [Arapaima gigas]
MLPWGAEPENLPLARAPSSHPNPGRNARTWAARRRRCGGQRRDRGKRVGCSSPVFPHTAELQAKGCHLWVATCSGPSDGCAGGCCGATMEREIGSEPLLDLSHLTEEEQGTILQVLMRDSELRCLDERRISKLRHSVSDPKRLKSLSGDWFNELWAKRHKKFGSDIVQASIRRKKKVKEVPLNVVCRGRASDKSSPNVLNGATLSTRDQVTPTPAPRRGAASSKVSHRVLTSTCVQRLVQTPLCVNVQDSQHALPLQVSKGRDSDSVSSSTATESDSTRLRGTRSLSSLQSNSALSGSMMSLFSSGEFDAVEVRGNLQFSLHYDTKKEELQVQVCRCQDLAFARKNRSDPYVKTYLLPDKSSHSKKKTSVKKKTVNPIFDETLKYKVKMTELKGRTLNLSVWHHDPLRRNIFLGEVEVGMADWDWGQKEPCWRPLVPRVQLSQNTISSRGTIMLSIKFVPAGSEGDGLPITGELHIWLKEAQGLIPTKGGTVDSFVKSYVLPDQSRSSRQKTRVVKHTVSPTFNHTMVYDGFQTSDLNEACAEITVWEKDSLSSHQLGGVRLSTGTGQSYGQPVVWMDSTEEEVNVWTTMVQSPNTWVDTALPLRTDLVPRKE